MSNGTISLEELAHRIETREDQKTDVIMHPANLQVGPTGRLEVKNDPGIRVKVAELAHDQIASWSPIGTRYYRHMLENSPELWAENVNHWLSKGEKPRMLRLLDDMSGQPEVLRAFLSDQFGRYEDIHLLRPVLERVHERGWNISHCALTERRMHIRISFPKLEGEIKVGDYVRAGASFTNSEVGLGKWMSQFYLERLVCMNGMVMKDMVAGFARTHLTAKQSQGWLSPSTLALEDQLLQSQVADTLDAMTDSAKFEKVLALMRGTTEQEIEHPVEAVRVLARRASLSQDEQEQVVREQVRGGDSTLWGLVNALTATARDLPNFDRRAELEDMAGRIIATPSYSREIVEAEPARAA